MGTALSTTGAVNTSGGFRLILLVRIDHVAEQIAATRSDKPDLHHLEWISWLPF